jgi:hypothetical protein
MFENEVVSVAVTRWNGANSLEILDLLDARRHTRRSVTGARCTARHGSLRTDSQCEADDTTRYDNGSLHVRFSSHRDERDLLVMTPASAGR